MSNEKSIEEWQAELGQQVRDIRLRMNYSQRQLAERAGVALNVVKRLEYGEEVQVSSLIKVLRILGRVEWLNTLAPVVSISPLQLLHEKPRRQRAFSPKGARNV